MINLSKSDQDRFWSKVEIGSDDECWNWLPKARSHSGYGVFKIANGRPGGVNIVSSRIAAFLAFGTPPEGRPNALHSCDNPACCNPAHLRWGNQKDNVSDAIMRGRQKKPPIKRAFQGPPPPPAYRKGEKVWNQSLDEETVRLIWRRFMSGESSARIAKDLGKSAYVVYDVVRGKSWRHLPDAPTVDELKKGGKRRGFNQFGR
jgi:hypothetical protein